MGTITRTIANNLTITSGSSGTMIDVWRLASDHSSTSTASTVIGWERSDDATSTQVGSSLMTESSGIWTFPATGKYLILAVCNFNSSGNDSNYNELSIQGTTDNGGAWDFLSGSSDDMQSGTNERASTTQLAAFNCTDTANDKIRFRAFSQNTVAMYGDSTGNRTHVLFMKL